MIPMTKKQRRHSPEQIIRKLAEGHKLMAGGMKADDAKRLKELESENTMLKRLLAEAELDKAMLKHLNEGKW